MSAQFGRWNFEGEPPLPSYIERVSATLAPYGPDSNETYSNGGVDIVYRAFHTTKEAHRETQPHVCPSGAVITWDGRLDNGTELIRDLHANQLTASTDVAIVALAYEKWGPNCFARLVGNWAVSIWNPNDRSLILTTDPIGIRHLYYSVDEHNVIWSTILDPLVQFGGRAFKLNEEYIAGCLSLFPATHLTPWVGIHSVPASSSVLLRAGKQMIWKYWDFDPAHKIRYHSDTEYEEHFRAVFKEAVQRCLRSDRPVLSELSGGRDSASIVCMADIVIADGSADIPRLDTVSYYDNSEPNWNERPYFTKVEEKRGRRGCHINVGLQDPEGKIHGSTGPESSFTRFAAVPWGDGCCSPQFRMCLSSQGHRVVLSGIGGDEVMGGVPTPTPELEDLLVNVRFGELAHQLKVWALQQKKPWWHLFAEAVRGFFPPTLVGVSKYLRPAPWLRASFVTRQWLALTGYPSRIKLFGPLPSFQENLSALDGVRRQLSSAPLPQQPHYEKRYPYLDRGLLEFIYGIPRDQLVRPSQRRSLMRRALVGIVPDEILNKKGKAFVVRAPLVAIANDWGYFVEMTQRMVSSSKGIVDADCILEALQKGRRGEDIRTTALLRTMRIEGWLKSLQRLGYIDSDRSIVPPMPGQPKTWNWQREQ